jgi:hypothetical protein
VGKATASIVKAALDAGRMVAVVLPDMTYQRAVGIDTLDANDYRAGWLLRIDN